MVARSRHVNGHFCGLADGDCTDFIDAGAIASGLQSLFALDEMIRTILPRSIEKYFSTTGTHLVLRWCSANSMMVRDFIAILYRAVRPYLLKMRIYSSVIAFLPNIICPVEEMAMQFSLSKADKERRLPALNASTNCSRMTLDLCVGV